MKNEKRKKERANEFVITVVMLTDFIRYYEHIS